MVRVGNSCNTIATSPKCRSRSTRATSVPPAARATARLVARKVLPQPPLALNTVMISPGRPPGASGLAPPGPAASRPRSEVASSIARDTDERTVSPSLEAASTSRTPNRSAARSIWPDSLWRSLLQPRGQAERLLVVKAGADQRGQDLPPLGRDRAHGLIRAGGAQDALVEPCQG